MLPGLCYEENEQLTGKLKERAHTDAVQGTEIKVGASVVDALVPHIGPEKGVNN